MTAKKKPYCYDTMFARDEWDAHDDSCESLPWFWLGHPGGFSNPGDLGDCDNCDVTFYWEGLAWPNWQSDDDPIRLCGCCARKAGYQVEVSDHGVSTVACAHQDSH